MTPLPKASQRNTRVKVAVRVDDILLAILLSLSGPLLWWSGQLWIQQGSQGALSHVESFLSTLCALVAALLCLVTFGCYATGVVLYLGHKLHRPEMKTWGLRLSPAFVRRILAATVGTQILLAPMALAADSADESGLYAQSPVSTMANVNSSNWLPTIASNDIDKKHVRAAEHADSSTVANSQTGWLPSIPVVPPNIQSIRHSADARSVTVKKNDSLWLIAKNELGVGATDLEIDQRWREWWALNRKIIGDNPHLLLPGVVLVAPPNIP